MNIAINIKSIGSDENETTGNFMFEVFNRVIRALPQHTFIIISEKPTPAFAIHNNVINVPIGLQARHPAQWLVWYTLKINLVLKKYKAAFFISNNVGCSATVVPQCIVVTDLNFIYEPKTFKKTVLFFYKKYAVKCFKKAALLLTVSAFCKTSIVSRFAIKDDIIQVTYKGIAGADEEMTNDEKEKIKEQYTDGNEYFLYTGEIGLQKNILNLLKAFSAFKKRQKSSMQLVMAGAGGFKYEEIIESLRLFKYKSEVKIITGIADTEMKKITAAAYAFVNPEKHAAFATEALRAMKSKVPVIASSSGSLPEICVGAALYADPENFKELAVQMMALFKNETTRNDFAKKSKEQAEKYSWDITAALVLQNINKVLKI